MLQEEISKKGFGFSQKKLEICLSKFYFYHSLICCALAILCHACLPIQCSQPGYYSCDKIMGQLAATLMDEQSMIYDSVNMLYIDRHTRHREISPVMARDKREI